jgi:hypothetical protein
MTLKSALLAIKKNPNLFLKRGEKLYQVDNSAYHKGIPQTIHLVDGMPDRNGHVWAGGFAWANTSNSQYLQICYDDLTAKNWEVMDASHIALSYEVGSKIFRDYVKKFDEKNQYSQEVSKYGQELLLKGNGLLADMNAPFVLTYTRMTVNSSADYHLTATTEADATWRYKCSKALFEMVKELTTEKENQEERAKFERFRPGKELVVEKVNMQEFLNRVRSSTKLWSVDATNAHKRTRAGKLVGKDWANAPLYPASLVKSSYGGARVDRLAERNALTNAIGLSPCVGRQFYSLDDKDGCGGLFFADVVRHYGEDHIIIDDNVVLDLQHDMKHTIPNSCLGYAELSPNKRKTSYKPIMNVLNKRLSSFEEYAK